MNASSELVGEVLCEEWQLKEPFVLSRGARTHAEVVYLRVGDGEVWGQAECQPNSRYGETSAEVKRQLDTCFPADLTSLKALSRKLPSFAARNALDCALLDYQIKSGILPSLDACMLGSVPTYFTLSVSSPADMARAAGEAYTKGCRRLKLKFAGDGDDERLIAVRAAAPDASLIIDANEAWNESMLAKYLPLLESQGVELLEQPLPVGADEVLRDIETSLIICADESCHTLADLENITGKYSAINIKLDKAGGLSPATEILQSANQLNLKIMVGCMLGTSLAIAPAFKLAIKADFVDLDAPLLLGADRPHGFGVNDSFIYENIQSKIWGY